MDPEEEERRAATAFVTKRLEDYRDEMAAGQLEKGDLLKRTVRYGDLESAHGRLSKIRSTVVKSAFQSVFAKLDQNDPVSSRRGLRIMINREGYGTYCFGTCLLGLLHHPPAEGLPRGECLRVVAVGTAQFARKQDRDTCVRGAECEGNGGALLCCRGCGCCLCSRMVSRLSSRRRRRRREGRRTVTACRCVILARDRLLPGLRDHTVGAGCVVIGGDSSL